MKGRDKDLKISWKKITRKNRHGDGRMRDVKKKTCDYETTIVWRLCVSCFQYCGIWHWKDNKMLQWKVKLFGCLS